jgi:hypothetical protein
MPLFGTSRIQPHGASSTNLDRKDPPFFKYGISIDEVLFVEVGHGIRPRE